MIENIKKISLKETVLLKADALDSDQKNIPEHFERQHLVLWSVKLPLDGGDVPEICLGVCLLLLNVKTKDFIGLNERAWEGNEAVISEYIPVCINLISCYWVRTLTNCGSYPSLREG